MSGYKIYENDEGDVLVTVPRQIWDDMVNDLGSPQDINSVQVSITFNTKEEAS